MADPSGFLRHERSEKRKRPVPLRLLDWREVYEPGEDHVVRQQAERCMDCGIPFCQSAGSGCPLGNRIPDWNDSVRRGEWGTAIEQLHATNNFPEFTGKLCPAPCESACVLGIAAQPVAIKHVEASIIERAFADGAVHPLPPKTRSGKSVGVVGSGPAGLAAAQQLARAGHRVVVYERDDALGGLLRYGIPDFKLEKHHVDRRVEQLRAEHVEFVTNCEVGLTSSAEQLRAEHDALLLACGALAGRDMAVPGRDGNGVKLAMEYLIGANRFVAGKAPSPPISAEGKRVVIIGGGDTAADCLGVAHRQRAASVIQLDMYPEPPRSRDDESEPWPVWPLILHTYPAHEEGGERAFGVAVREFGSRDGQVQAVQLDEVRVRRKKGKRQVEVVPGEPRKIPADLVLLAIGFEGTEDSPLFAQLGLDRRTGVIPVENDWQSEVPGVFVAGDMHRGASLIVWAIAEGRSAAAAIHRYLGGADALPSPVASDEAILTA